MAEAEDVIERAGGGGGGGSRDWNGVMAVGDLIPMTRAWWESRGVVGGGGGGFRSGWQWSCQSR